MYQSTFIVAIGLQVMHLGTAHATAYVTGTGMAYVLTLFFAGGLAARLGPRASLLTGIALVAAALLFQGGAPSAAWLWPGVLLQGAGLGLLQIVTLTRVARAGARLGQGKVSGLNLLVQPIGSLCGTALGGLLAQHVGLQNVFFLLLPAFALLAVWQLRQPAPHVQAPLATAQDVAPATSR